MIDPKKTRPKELKGMKPLLKYISEDVYVKDDMLYIRFKGFEVGCWWIIENISSFTALTFAHSYWSLLKHGFYLNGVYRPFTRNSKRLYQFGYRLGMDLASKGVFRTGYLPEVGRDLT